MLHEFRYFHWRLFIITLAIGLLGLINMYSAASNLSGHYAFKQLIWTGVGILVMLAVYLAGYRPFLNVAYLLYGISLFLLGIVLVIGVVRGGAQRWIGFGGMGIQPSEFCKMATVITLATFLGSRKDRAHSIRGFVAAFALTIVPLVVILMQPDLGTALVFLPILFCMLFIWGARLRYLFTTLALGLASVPFLWMTLLDYQRKRILVFFNPDIDPLGAGYTAIQSKIAVGSGGLMGRGFLNGTQQLLAFLPEKHTDFIFGVLAEEWGFLGSFLLLLLYALLLWQMFSILTHTTDLEARLLGTGVISIFVFHIFINIGMTVGLMPITGLPLPLMSYGGSSAVSFFAALGFILSIDKERSFY